MRKRRFTSALRVLVLLALLVPLSASVDASGQSEVAHWRTIHNQGFEGAFPPSAPPPPAASWVLYDASHTSTQGTWGKHSGGFSGSFSASPRPNVTPYNYNTHTWMRYGPFSLAGPTNARMLFKYWLDSEAGYDFFTWAYSCRGINGPWIGRSLSGNLATWTSASLSLRPCLGRRNVYVKFTFTSDQSVNYQGVRVDAIQIQKFS